MLEACVPGYSTEEKEHHWWVRYNGQAYRGLPLGEHGARRDPEIEVRHVRHLARFFQIIDCAKEQLPQLR